MTALIAELVGRKWLLHETCAAAAGDGQADGYGPLGWANTERGDFVVRDSGRAHDEELRA